MVFRYRFLITFLILLNWCSCTNTYFTKDLDGEWVNKADPHLCFAFAGQRCSYAFPTGHFAHYSIADDTLIIKDTIRSRGKSFKVKTKKYRILDLDETELVLLGPPKAFKRDIRYKHLVGDTIYLEKLQPKRKHNVLSLTFESTMCYGTCPAMELTIHNLDSVFFNGKMYTELRGHHSGILTEDQRRRIQRKIDHIDLENLKPNYSASWTDDQTCSISFDLGDTTIYTRAYGFNKEPLALRILFNELMELYKDIDLQLDSLHRIPLPQDM